MTREDAWKITLIGCMASIAMGVLLGLSENEVEAQTTLLIAIAFGIVALNFKDK